MVEAIAKSWAFSSLWRAAPLRVSCTSFERRCFGLSMNSTSPSAAQPRKEV